MTFLVLVEDRVYHVYDDEAHFSRHEQERMRKRNMGWRAMDTTHHSCPAFAAWTGKRMDEAEIQRALQPCEGCQANAVLLEYVLRYARGLNGQVESLEAFKVDRPAQRNWSYP